MGSGGAKGLDIPASAETPKRVRRRLRGERVGSGDQGVCKEDVS